MPRRHGLQTTLRSGATAPDDLIVLFRRGAAPTAPTLSDRLDNFVFGSPGRYAKVPGTIPFSLAVALELRREAEGIVCTLRLCPLLTDNIATDYWPSPVTAEDLNTIAEALSNGSSGTTPPWLLDDVATGPTLVLPIGTLPLTDWFHRTGRLGGLVTIARSPWTSEFSPRCS